MLLNQCLAISLLPIGSIDCRKQVEATPLVQAKKQNLEVGAEKEEADDKQQDLQLFSSQAKQTLPIAHTVALSVSSAASIFKKLVELNSQQLEPKNQTKSGGRLLDSARGSSNSSSSERLIRLGAAIRRVEFAGFVLPSWLLLSGSYNDLHCLKTSWSEGNFKSPAGFRIETIGNIRSVNIDYFGSSQIKSTATDEAAGGASGGNRIRQIETVNAVADSLETEQDEEEEQEEEEEEAKVLQQLTKQQQTLSRLSRSNDRKNHIRKFAPLNAAILESVVELRLQLYEDYLNNNRINNNNNYSEEEDSHQAKLVEPLKSENPLGLHEDSKFVGVDSFGVHIGKLIEHLNTKYANQIDLPPVELIDCAINGLVRSAQLSVRPMSQEQMENSLNNNNYYRQANQQQQQQQQTRGLKKIDQSLSSGTQLPREWAQHHQSVFVDQLIEPGQELLRNHHHQTNKHYLPATKAATVCRTPSNWSNITPKSKSTTLDSGIQSWDLGNSPTYQDTSDSSTTGQSAGGGSNGGSHCIAASFPSEPAEFRKKEQVGNKEQTGWATNHSHQVPHHDSHYPRLSRSSSGSRGHRAEQVEAAAVSAAATSAADAATADPQTKATKTGNYRLDGRRGYSHTRSLSFRPKKSADRNQQHQHQGHPKETDRWRELEQAKQQQRLQPHNPALNSCGHKDTANTTNTAHTQTIGSSGRPTCANLTSLFRSKSMRIISSGKGDRFRWQPQNSENLDGKVSRDTGEEVGEINCDHKNQQQQQQELVGHLRSDRNELERQAAEFKASKRRQLATTIDYLATAQPHKRSLSVRRSSSNNNSNPSNNTTCNPPNRKDNDLGGGGGRIALFLRKLFSVRRSRSMCVDQQRAVNLEPRLIDQAAAAPPMTAVEQVDREEKEAMERELSMAMERRVVPANGEAFTTTTTNATAFLAGRTHRAAKSQLQTKKSISASPTSSSASSGSNSLIEILDCSPAVNRSKRTLREELPPSGCLNRATWRLVERSHSSLSQNSDDSCSTTKSTVSQQLRRHLDEAYKRHRNCTNQREKEFIDSINVLRQASRHALQNSRSPSTKSRQAKSGAGSSSSRAKSSASDDTTTTISSLSGSSIPADHHLQHHHDEMKLAGPSSPGDTCTSAACHCKRVAAGPFDLDQMEACTTNTSYHHHHHHNHHPDNNQPPLPSPPAPSRAPDLSQFSHHHHGGLLPTRPEHHEQDDDVHDDLDKQQSNGITEPEPAGIGHLDHEWPAGAAKPLQQQQSLQAGGGCCLFSTYQQQLSACPLAYCLGTPTSPPAPPQLACCCFAATATATATQQDAGAQRMQQCGSDAGPPHLCKLTSSIDSLDPHQSTGASDPLCCPLWRSMLYAYCQPIYPPPPPPLVQPPLLAPLQNLSQQQVAEQLKRQLENHYSSATSHQQHQHNTTIDLKIEIGADFNNKTRQLKKRDRSFDKIARGSDDSAARSFEAHETEVDDDRADVEGGKESDTNGYCGNGDDSLDSTGHQSDESLAMVATKIKGNNYNNNDDDDESHSSNASDEDNNEDELQRYTGSLDGSELRSDSLRCDDSEVGAGHHHQLRS